MSVEGVIFRVGTSNPLPGDTKPRYGYVAIDEDNGDILFVFSGQEPWDDIEARAKSISKIFGKSVEVYYEEDIFTNIYDNDDWDYQPAEPEEEDCDNEEDYEVEDDDDDEYLDLTSLLSKKMAPDDGGVWKSV